MRNRTFIALGGKAGSGKSEVAKILVEKHGFILHKFATPLKNMLSVLGVSDERIHGDMKEEPSDILCGKTARYAMQTLGTDWGRDLIGDDIWVNAWEKTIPDSEFIVVDDMRFQNEMKMIHDIFGSTHLIVRTHMKDIENNQHVSENSLNINGFDSVLTNDGTLAKLENEIVRLVEEWSYIR